MRKNRDLAVVLLIAAGGLLFALLDVQSPLLRALTGLPLALFLPGYALEAAIFTRRDLRTEERAAISLGTSLAVAALTGLALTWMPWGLQAKSWAIALAGVTILSSLAALLRRLLFEEENPPNGRIGLSSLQGLLLGAAVLLAAGAYWLASQPTPTEGLQGYTMLWLLPKPTVGTGELQLGINSQEFGSTDYRLEVWALGRLVKVWPDLELKSGETWQANIQLSGAGSVIWPVEARLYRQDIPQKLYRLARYWLGPS